MTTITHFSQIRQTLRRSAFAVLGATAVAVALSACSGMGGPMAPMMAPGVALSGSQEVPPVNTSAAGTGSITIAADGAVSGSITTTGIAGTMAHVHMAAMGKNGPVIVPMTKTADGVWSVPAGAKLTPEQLTAYKAGELYVNVHSEANKGGEIRAQLKP